MFFSQFRGSFLEQPAIFHSWVSGGSKPTGHIQEPDLVQRP
uniref:Uncharacterized protein n=1 Tax=Setaria italica TaxID=4555 RepID=K3XTY4_SETIT